MEKQRWANNGRKVNRRPFRVQQLLANCGTAKELLILTGARRSFILKETEERWNAKSSLFNTEGHECLFRGV